MRVEQMLELTQLLGECKPVVSKVIEDLSAYSQEWEKIVSFILNQQVSQRTQLFNSFVDNGFSREEAMTLTLASVREFKDLIEKMSKNGK